ncbi:MAG TPA: penicillin-binding transpeptidase domain-containing protein [Rhodothermales bacterium]|nr:penicillin-binding transpeptidase domain-containing protein [Rhodothermales bacterium]
MDIKGQILARTYVVLVVLCVLPGLVVMRVLHIYLDQGEELRDIGVRQASSYQVIPAMRGAILDRQGRVLAVNTGRYDLALDPKVEGFEEEQGTFFDKLSKLTGSPASHYRRLVQRRASPNYVLLVRDLNEAQKEVVDSWDVPGVLLTPEFGRRYNYGQTAAHILGYVGADGKGLAGIEMQYDRYLRGEPGRRAVKRDRLGHIKAFVGGSVVEPQNGESVVLTIDLIRQTILEEELARGMEETKANWGTAIAMDPRTGAILALANMPTYDPNRPGDYRTAARRNHAITDQIEPGSAFKIVAAAAALDKGRVSLHEQIDTGPGYLMVNGRMLRDSHPLGVATFEEIIAESSNIGFHLISERLDPGSFYRYARALGFGQPTWIDLPGETAGVLKRPSEWSRSTRSAMSRGYEVAVSPLQILTAYCALANGGILPHPHVVSERRDVTGRTVWRAPRDSVRRAFKEETAKKLIPAFEMTVEDGTAKRAQIAGLPIAGKTGTAQKVENGHYVSAHRTTFVGFFPADDPQVALVVVLDAPKTAVFGGTASAPIFQRIASRWIGTFPKIAERLAPTAPLPTWQASVIPDTKGLPSAVAADRLLAAGLQVAAPVRGGKIVDRQVPAAGTRSDSSTVVRLWAAASADSLKMPDLTGLSAREASFWLASRGVPYKIDGTGRVVDQSPAAGEPLPRLATIACQ